jgi:asparagine synthase (glutamine-hydrolysing)
MSGFVAVLSLDGAPNDPAEISSLAEALKVRGLDQYSVWTGDGISLAHATLQLAEDASVRRQPCCLDGSVWITGDIRVDGRADLYRALRAAGQSPAASASDAELVLHAYRAWGEALLDHLLGDFSFALWDCASRSLLCGRDQFGVRPLFYARAGNRLLVSNTLLCLRSHPDVSDALNDAAIGDFLLHGFNRDPATTSFEDVRRVPGGHLLTCTPGSEPRIRRYWSLPRYDELRLKGRGEYVERFRQIFDEAVSDRIRDVDFVGINMSGGLDSPLIAATARDILARRGGLSEVRAYTVVYDRLFRDEERHFSQLAADRLGIPIEYLAADDFGLFKEGAGHPFLFPEPLDGLSRPSFASAARDMVDPRCRVVLTGYDGDALLIASPLGQLADFARNLQLGALASGSVRYAAAKRKPFQAVLRRLPRWRSRAQEGDEFPIWLNPDFKRRARLRDRWESQYSGPKRHEGPRAGAHNAMSSEMWPAVLEGYDSGFTGVPADHRHPLLDLRLVRFCLSLPAIPWCVDKHMFREAGRDVLPEPVRLRPKAPLGGNPVRSALRTYLAKAEWLPLHPELANYVDVGLMEQVIDELGTEGYWFALRVFTLNYWLLSRKGGCK